MSVVAPDFGQIVEYVTEDGIHPVNPGQHSLDSLPTLEAVREDYAKVTGLGRQPALTAGELDVLKALAGAVYHSDVIENEIKSTDPAEVVQRLIFVRSRPEWYPGADVEAEQVWFHAGNLYEVILGHTTQAGWEPGAPGTDALWKRYYEPEAGPQPWVQPQGVHDAYAIGAEVTHKGKTWRSTYAGANVWEPGVFGWVVV